MIIVDTALKKRQEERNPVKVGMIGAGFMGRGIALQISQYIPGMKLVAIANRNIENARIAYAQAGIQDISEINSLGALNDSIRDNKYSVTGDAALLCDADEIDVIIEVTGTIEYAARHILRAINNKKHVVMMNPEVDSTVGSILKHYADKAQVILTTADGDQPGVEGNLYRFVKTLGVTPVLCGNIKGLHDPYRNPTTQKAFAEKWGQKAHMVTSFADGTKISFEQAIVANATGMRVGKRGMFGPTVDSGTPLKEAVGGLYPLEALLDGPGIVDYVVGAEPSAGVFVLGTHDHPVQKHYLNLYKLGEGPLYLFYTPYHLCHFEAPLTAARAVLFHDAALAPIGAPTVEVISAAKIDLKAGETLDGLGHYMTYGLCENADIVRSENLLPIGLAEGCRLKNDIHKDEVISWDEVEFDQERLVYKLYQEQTECFGKPVNISQG
jgi:predicted homoserine dehydrogenase-like protein